MAYSKEKYRAWYQRNIERERKRSRDYGNAHAAERKQRNAKYRAAHGDEVRAAQRRRSAKTPAHVKTAANRRWRGLPEPTRPMPEVCDCCGGPSNGRGSLHFDHCHRTNRFRGWLCSTCNTAIGKLGDTAAGVARAVAYLLDAERG